MILLACKRHSEEGYWYKEDCEECRHILKEINELVKF
jgi:hypothetical protein